MLPQVGRFWVEDFPCSEAAGGAQGVACRPVAGSVFWNSSAAERQRKSATEEGAPRIAKLQILQVRNCKARLIPRIPLQWLKSGRVTRHHTMDVPCPGPPQLKWSLRPGSGHCITPNRPVSERVT